MNVRLLRVMQKCCDNAASFAADTPYGQPALHGGELCATDKIVAVRYRETAWRDLPMPEGTVAIPTKAVSTIALSASAMVEIDPSGVRLPDGRILGETIGSYPDLHRLWETLTRPVSALDKEAPMTDPKHLRRVLAVFDAARIKPVIRNVGRVLTLEGLDGHCEIQALVCGCRK